jgi:hypothetical protein
VQGPFEDPPDQGSVGLLHVPVSAPARGFSCCSTQQPLRMPRYQARLQTLSDSKSLLMRIGSRMLTAKAG